MLYVDLHRLRAGFCAAFHGLFMALLRLIVWRRLGFTYALVQGREKVLYNFSIISLQLRVFQKWEGDFGEVE